MRIVAHSEGGTVEHTRGERHCNTGAGSKNGGKGPRGKLKTGLNPSTGLCPSTGPTKSTGDDNTNDSSRAGADFGPNAGTGRSKECSECQQRCAHSPRRSVNSIQDHSDECRGE